LYEGPPQGGSKNITSGLLFILINPFFINLTELPLIHVILL